ncbi:MAG: DUF4011 domain-containing protein, partial [Gemmatimonadota bacterium]|nr:DUF4011 domain-containing protein [Gemmatimonadota bacterium]
MDKVSIDNATQSPGSAHSRIQSARSRLWEELEASYLLHTPRSAGDHGVAASAPVLELQGGNLDRVCRHLVLEGTPLGLRPRHGGDMAGPAPSPSFRLTADLPGPQLSRQLELMGCAAQAHEAGATASELCLALGFLRWTDPGGSGIRRSPLLLIPVTLEPGEEPDSLAVGTRLGGLRRNDLLAQVLRREHWVELPEWNPSGESPVSRFLAGVRTAVARQDGWIVEDDGIALASFDWGTFRHHVDLDPVSWRHGSAPQDHEIVRALLGGLFYTSPEGDLDPSELEEPPFSESPFEGLDGPGIADHLLTRLTPGHVLDADGHQALAIEEVRQGFNLIISGPAGSGRTQTVANIVCGAVREGRKVLVVSRRRADLADLHQRLEEAEVSPPALALYGRHLQLSRVLADLERTFELPDPDPAPTGGTAQQLRAVQSRLNAHVQQMHYPHSFAGISAYQVFGWTSRLKAKGTSPLSIALEGAREWDMAFLSDATDHVARLANHLDRMGTPGAHPWRGVGMGGPRHGEGSSERPSPAELHDSIGTFQETLSDWERRVRRLAALLCVQYRALGDVSCMAAMAEQILRAPVVDRQAIRSPVWRRGLGEIQILVRNGQLLEDARDEVDPVLISAAWNQDLSQVRQSLKAYGDSLLKWANPAFRKAHRQLKGLAQNEIPDSLTEQIRILDALARGQEALHQLTARDDLGREAFGKHWHGPDSEWSHLASITGWMASATSPLSNDLATALARTADRRGLARLARDAEAGTGKIQEAFARLAGALDLNVHAAFGTDGIEEVPIVDLNGRLRDWVNNPEGLQEWTTYLVWGQEVRELGLGTIADRLVDGSLDPSTAVDAFHLTYLEELSRQLFDELPELADFNGGDHESLQTEFRALDSRLLEQTRARVRAVHKAGLPLRSKAGEVGMLLDQMGGTREGHARIAQVLPLPELLRQAGHAIQAIKPVFLMTPTAVAELLEPGHLTFDLVVLESADRISADRALG